MSTGVPYPPERVPDPEEDARRGFPEVALGASARVRQENGQWVVYLAVSFWEPGDGDNPVRSVWHRISSHSTKRRAEVTARYIEQAANRALPNPPAGF